MARLIFRPLPAWTDPVTKRPVPHQFQASWRGTQLLLRREVDAIARKLVDPEVIIQVAGLTEAEYTQEIALVKETLAGLVQAEPHWREYLEAWE